MEIVMRKTDELIPYVNNARKNDHAVDAVASSIKNYGFKQPIVIDGQGEVVAGHTRLKAAKKLGLKEVPVIVADDLTPAQVKAYRIADNRVSELAEWDMELLQLELDDIEGFTGFEDLELPNEVEKANDDDFDAEKELEQIQEPITQRGWIYKLGNHRLMCGDSTSEEDVKRLIYNQKINMILTDPPYGIEIVKSNKVGGDKPFGDNKNGKVIKANEYFPIIGDGSIEVARLAISIIKNLNIDVQIIWGGNYYANHLENSNCWIVWDKKNTGNFADAELAWTNQKTAVRIFSHMWNGMIKESERGEKRVHPTQKPVKLFEWCIENYGQDCNNILDLFGGSGVCLIASEIQNKNAFIMELSPNYCDVIIKRWENMTGQKAERIE